MSASLRVACNAKHHYESYDTSTLCNTAADWCQQKMFFWGKILCVERLFLEPKEIHLLKGITGRAPEGFPQGFLAGSHCLHHCIHCYRIRISQRPAATVLPRLHKRACAFVDTPHKADVYVANKPKHMWMLPRGCCHMCTYVHRKDQTGGRRVITLFQQPRQVRWCSRTSYLD